MGLTIGFESISQVMFKVCFSAALITLPSYWHVGGSVCNAEVERNSFSFVILIKFADGARKFCVEAELIHAKAFEGCLNADFPCNPPPTNPTHPRDSNIMSFNAKINLAAWLPRGSFAFTDSRKCSHELPHISLHREFINGLDVISPLPPVIPIEINQLTFNI